MRLKVLLSLFILALTMIACVSEFDATLPSNDIQVLIVDGSIMENTDAVFYLSKSFPLDLQVVVVSNNNIPDKYLVTDAKLTIISDNGYQSLPAENLGKGAYQISVGELDNDVKYGIQIEYNGDTYQSALSKPLQTPEIDSISWVQPETAGTVSFRVSTHDDTAGVKFFLWDYKEDWEIKATYPTTIFYNPAADGFYTAQAPYQYCWKKFTSNKFLIGSTESLSENRIINNQLYRENPGDDRFSVLYSVIVHQKAISKEAFEYYQNKIKLNDEMGGLFTPQPSELNGNITCITNPSKKVMGYVEACKNVTEKRIFITSDQITHPWISGCDLIPQDTINQYIADGRYASYLQFYQMGYRPAGDPDSQAPGLFPESWALGSCTDCILYGGTKNKPDFWPDNHE
ncbi:MAG: DUF4249 domain-containing protein [Candidatus Azobacteroides sp.]|nr:DUF4249 domain-containing protein [Candidatus Azobacteroides sp.]